MVAEGQLTKRDEEADSKIVPCELLRSAKYGLLRVLGFLMHSFHC